MLPGFFYTYGCLAASNRFAYKLTHMIVSFILRLVIAGVLGTAIGLEREYRAKEAGFRTHFLVSLGSALLMIVSQHGFGDVLGHAGIGLDPSRVAAQVVSGIGFIGAGTIILQKKFVRGLTTAAGLWATAGIGLAIGGGMYEVGIAATVLALIGLEVLNHVFKNLGLKSFLLVFSTMQKEAVNRIIDTIHKKGYIIMNYSMEKKEGTSDSYQVSVVMKAKGATNESQLLLLLQQIPDVTVERLE